MARGMRERLPGHRGHFYNWFATETLRPLHPLYVSTVDSGNLTGHLLTLRQGLLAQADAPVLAPATWQGLRDTLALLEEAGGRSEEHTSELQSLMRISYAVFCLKKKRTDG